MRCRLSLCLLFLLLLSANALPKQPPTLNVHVVEPNDGLAQDLVAESGEALNKQLGDTWRTFSKTSDFAFDSMANLAQQAHNLQVLLEQTPR